MHELSRTIHFSNNSLVPCLDISNRFQSTHASIRTLLYSNKRTFDIVFFFYEKIFNYKLNLIRLCESHHVFTHHLVLSFKEKVFLGYIVAWRRNFSRFLCNIPESRRVIAIETNYFILGAVTRYHLNLSVWLFILHRTTWQHAIISSTHTETSRSFIWKYSVVTNMRVISFMDMQIHVTVLPYVCRTRISGHLIYIYVREKK